MATRPHATQIVRRCGVAIMLTLSCRTAAAQELNFSVALDSTSYGGGAYAGTDGDRGGEIAVGFEMSRGLRLAGGVFLGKFDEPISDPSFTDVSLFFEPSWVFRRTARVRPVVGARVGWEHQRVGDYSNDLWAYGWSVSGVGGALVRLGRPVSVGVRTVVSALNAERNNDVSRNGVRLQLGGMLILTWPLR